ncbi:hypothetical protein LEJE111609_01755 [Lelliottia jeotgali]
MNQMISFYRFINPRLKYRYFLLLKTMWAGIHCNLFAINKLVNGVNKSTRFSFVKSVTLRISFKIFELGNFCLERYVLVLKRACELNERHAFTLNRSKF